MEQKEIKFKQDETKVALWLLDDLNERILKLDHNGRVWSKEAAANESDQKHLFAIGAFMERDLLLQAVEQLKKDIENQSFSF